MVSAIVLMIKTTLSSSSSGGISRTKPSMVLLPVIAALVIVLTQYLGVDYIWPICGLHKWPMCGLYKLPTCGLYIWTINVVYKSFATLVIVLM